MVNTIKVLSKNFRPLCDYCGIICGLVWFQQKSVPDKLMSLCVKCYTNGNFPPILSADDFERNTLESQFEKTNILDKIGKGDVNKSHLLKQRVKFSTEETLHLLQEINDNPNLHWEELCHHMNNTF